MLDKATFLHVLIILVYVRLRITIESNWRYSLQRNDFVVAKQRNELIHHRYKQLCSNRAIGWHIFDQYVTFFVLNCATRFIKSSESCAAVNRGIALHGSYPNHVSSGRRQRPGIACRRWGATSCAPCGLPIPGNNRDRTRFSCLQYPSSYLTKDTCVRIFPNKTREFRTTSRTHRTCLPVNGRPIKANEYHALDETTGVF
jgi:hypothetical protein